MSAFATFGAAMDELDAAERLIRAQGMNKLLPDLALMRRRLDEHEAKLMQLTEIRTAVIAVILKAKEGPCSRH